MENQLYKMMIKNAASYLRTFDSKNQSEEYLSDRISVFGISSVLAICTGKTKEDIILDIVNCD